MKVIIKSIPLLVAAFLVLMGIADTATAGRGMGYGHRGGYSGYAGDLSKDDIKAIDKERRAFFEATRDLRQDMYRKELELQTELAQKNPDAKKAAALQENISKLESEFDQKRLAHMLNMRKIAPEAGMMGPGMMSDDDGDWNCPYGGRTMGRGRGYGMKGSGYGMGGGMMMGRGSGMGPGMMGRGYGAGREWMRGSPEEGISGQGSGRLQTPLKEDDARSVVNKYLASTRNPNLKLGQITEREDVFEAEIVTKDGSLVDKVIVDKSNGWMRPAYE
jgi:Spy/CpxP family protein refolding chaperone